MESGIPSTVTMCQDCPDQRYSKRGCSTELSRFIRPWKTWLTISENMCRTACPRAAKEPIWMGGSTVVQALLVTHLQETSERQRHEYDLMPYYNV